MKRSSLWITLPLALGIVSAPRPAAAQSFQVFNDRAAFNAAAGSALKHLDFEDQVDGAEAQTVSYPGITFRSTEGYERDMLVLSPAVYSFPALKSKVVLCNRNYNPVVSDLSTPVTAFGAEVLVLPGASSVTVTVAGSDGTHAVEVPLVEGGPAFVGVVANSGNIAQVTVANPVGQEQFVGVDNVSFGDAPVAEPAPTPDPVDPLADGLAKLKAAIAEGRADGTIKVKGNSLENGVRVAEAALVKGNKRVATLALAATGKQVRVLRGRKIAPARADQLLGLLDQCLGVLCQ